MYFDNHSSSSLFYIAEITLSVCLQFLILICCLINISMYHYKSFIIIMIDNFLCKSACAEGLQYGCGNMVSGGLE